MLAEDPSLQDALRAESNHLPVFIEEALRLESPFRGHFRIVTEDSTLGGVELPKGSRVMLMWGSANRDANAFSSPEACDLGRAHPKAHVGFGSGIHFCLGAPLARMESRIVLERLLARTKSFRLAPGSKTSHVPSLFVRRLEALDLQLDPV
jgi:cytochrome P450